MEIGLPDGSTAKISNLPDFATEATQKRMLAQIKAMTKNNDKAKDAMDSLVTHAAGAAKADAKAAEDQKKAIKELSKEIAGGLKGFRTRFADRIESDTQQVFGFATSALGKLATSAIAAAGFMVGLAKATAAYAENTGKQMDAVTASGAGFGDNFGGSMSGVINGMRGYGLTLEQSTALMAEFSRATQTVGKYRIPALTGQFLSLTRNGKELGMTIHDASRAMMDELQQRSELYDISQMDSRTLSTSVARSVKLQNQYAGALGVSVDQLRKSVATQIKGNDYILASSLKFGPQFTQNMADFATILKGSAGDSIAPVADAVMSLIAAPESQITEQGQAIRMFGSQLSRTGVDINGFINKYQQQVQATGKFDGEAIGQEFVGLLRQALSKGGDVAQILNVAKAAGLNPEMIQSLTQSLVNLQTSATTTAKELKPDPFQEQVNSMRNTMNALNAVLDGAKQNLFGAAYKDMQAIIEGITLLIAPLSEAFVEIVRALTGTGAGESLKDAIASFGPTIKEAGTTIANFITGIRETLKKFTSTDGKTTKIDWAGFIGKMATDAIWGAFSLAGDIIAAAAGAIWENPKILLAILAGLGTLFAIAAAKSAAGAVVDGFKNKISDRISGRQPPGMPGGAGAPGAGAAPAPATLKSVGLDALKGLSGALTWVAKGAAIAASMYLIGKALPVLADGLKSFVDVEWESMAQVGATLVTLGGGLALLGKVPLTVIGKGFVGAAAISAAMVMIGFGLSQVVGPLERFQQINWETMGKAAAALVGLGVIGAVAGVFAAPLLLGAAAIGALGLALQLFPTDVLESLGGIIESIGTSIATVVGAMGDAIGKIVDKISALKTAGIDATTNQIERLSAIPSDRIQATASAIDQMKDALDGFGGSFLSNLGDAMTGNPVLELLSDFTFDPNPILSAANATNRLTASLIKFSEIDVSKINEVNSSIVGMARASNATVASMERVAKLDGKTIAENARAIMIYNGAAQGEIIVPPTPAAGADLSSFYQAIVRQLNGGPRASPAETRGLEGRSQPETLQQQMVRILSTIETNTATANRKLDEVTKAVR